METFTNDGFSFEVTDSGPTDGDTIVLLHGFPESRDAWDGVVPLLNAAGYRTLVPNQRGYSRGARPARRALYTLDKLAGDIIAMVDQAGVDRFHVVGHDWGGGVSWSLGANHAARVISTASMATPHPKAMVKSMTNSTQLFKSYYMFLFQLPRLPELAFTGRGRARTWASMKKSGLDQEHIDKYSALFLEPGAARGALNWYRGLFAGGNPNAVGPVAIPAMYIYGTADFALGPKAASLTADYCTGTYRYEVLEGTSHWIPSEVPERSAELILDFIKSLDH